MNDNVIAVDFSKGRTPPPAKRPAPSSSPADDDIRLMVFTLMIAESKVMVRVATSAPGLVIPEPLKAHPVTALNFSHKFGLADFTFDGRGVRATLGFGGVNSFCDVPWSAVFAMVCEKTLATCAWPNAMPMKESP